MTDLQCKKFYSAGNKMRILGRVSTTVQCIQNGRTGSNFHIKGFVVADLYKLLDTHCTQGIDAYFLRMSNCVWQLPDFCGLLPEGLSMVVYKISAF